MKLQKQVLLNLHSFNTIIVFEKTKSLDIEENELGRRCEKSEVSKVSEICICIGMHQYYVHPWSGYW